MKSKSSWQDNIKPSGSNVLTDNQRRKILVTIRFLEEDLKKLEQLFTDNNDMPPFKRKDLIDLLLLTGERSGALSEAFGLWDGTASASREALSILSALWSNLQEIKADKLRNYGTVSSEVELELDPDIDKIMDLISKMQQILRRRS